MGLRKKKEKKKNHSTLEWPRILSTIFWFLIYFADLYTCKPNHDNVKSKIKKIKKDKFTRDIGIMRARLPPSTLADYDTSDPPFP